MSYGNAPDMTAAQRKVLDYVNEYREVHQCPPSRAEISRHFGWSSANAAQEHLEALERKGFVRLVAGRSRGIFVC